ncbi:MAG: hypothetical protein ACI4Q7_02375 [Candidatus Avelusimicrobium sp.]
MSKGFVKVWRCEENVPELWNNTGTFCAYHKIKILASRQDWTLTAPWVVLAKKMAVSVGTLRKAVAELAKMGLIRAGQTDGGVTTLTLVYGDEEPDLDILMGAKRASGKEAQTRGAAPSCVSKIDTPAKIKMSKFDTPQMSKFDTPTLYKQEVKTNKKTTPTTPPTALFGRGFAAFWNVYPNKKAKDRAIKRWNRGNYDATVILPKLEQQIRLREWVKNEGRFVPRADAYLNQKRWQDELPVGEEAYVLDFKQPKTEREVIFYSWLEATNPALLKNDNQKINSTLEPDRVLFEQIVAKCGGNLQTVFKIMRHGWRLGCTSLRAIAERTAAYMDDLTEDK